MKPANYQDLTGKRFAKLTVLGRAPDRADKRVRWVCMCECGRVTEVITYSLNSGGTRSCGCIKEPPVEANITHGGSKERLYRVWNSMKGRCANPNFKEYPHYGGRGIAVCDEWLHDYAAFRKWALQNGYDPDAPARACSIDRIDNDGPYSPTNCRFTSQKEQCCNRRSTRFITVGGKTMTLTAWTKIIGVSRFAITQAENRGVPAEEYIARKLPNEEVT